MTEELLQDLALYKKSHDKSISIASRSLIALFREVLLLNLWAWPCACTSGLGHEVSKCRYFADLSFIIN